MKTFSPSLRRSQAGFTLAEVMISAAILGILTVGALMGSVALQRCFTATNGYSAHMGDELRISDYISRDLRQATAVTKTGTGTSTRLTLNIPNYYAPNGTPRDPVIDGTTGSVFYQDAAAVRNVPVVYYITSGIMYRNLNGVISTIATDVQDFDLYFLDSAGDPNAATDFNISNVSGKVAEVKLQIRFKTSFARLLANSGVNPSTGIFNTTLLRNIRTDAATGLY